MNEDLLKQILALETRITTEEKNYRTAFLLEILFDALKQMRENIQKLKADLQILLYVIGR